MLTNTRQLIFGGVAAGLISACPKQVPVPDDAPPPPPKGVVAPPQAPTGPGLIVNVQPTDAELIIDGASLGLVSKLTLENGLLPLKSGIYQVGLKRPGYVSWRAEVTVNDKPETIEVTLKQP